MKYEVVGRKLLFVEDNKELLEAMAEYFQGKGNAVFTASTLKQAKELYEREQLDAVVLDVILPDGDGLSLLEEHRTYPPVVILSDLGEEDDVTAGFFSGAADYIVKPCSVHLLEIRLSLRLLPPQGSALSLHGLTVNVAERTVKYKGTPVPLTSSEFNILHFLMSHAGLTFTSEEIYEQVWNAPSLQTTTVKRHLSTLRCKLKESMKQSPIVTEFGKGYCFVPEKQKSPSCPPRKEGN